MTKQEIFNKVVRGLARQKFKQSLNSRGSCHYRGTKGMRCAAGHLILNKHYQKSLEGCPAELPNVTTALRASGILLPQIPAVLDLQYCHDNNKASHKMKEALVNFARVNQLKVPRSLGAR